VLITSVLRCKAWAFSTYVLAFVAFVVSRSYFAAKDLLANFFGGLMVHLTAPCRGEWIRPPE
jgi:hypothetical protein